MSGENQRKALASQIDARGFVSQACVYILSGIVMVGLPLLTYARVAGLHVPGVPFTARIFGLLTLWVLLPGLGIMSTGIGAFALLGGLFYSAQARQSVLSGVENCATVVLSHRRKKRQLSYGSLLLTAKVTYEDGRSESINLCTRNCGLDDSIGQELRATVYGEPFGGRQPRVVAIDSSMLVEQPDERGLWNGIFGPVMGVWTQPDPLRKRLLAIVGQFLGYSALFGFVMMMQQQPNKDYIWFIVAVFGTGFLAIFAEVLETLVLAKTVKSAAVKPCSVILSKPKFSLLNSRNSVKASLLTVGQADSQELVLAAHGISPAMYGQSIEAETTRDAKGRILTVNNASFCLWNSRLQWVSLLPLVVYLSLLPVLVHQSQQELGKLKVAKATPVECRNSKEYYDAGIQFKACGWTEKAREALQKAIAKDPNGKYGNLAARYLHTHVPAHAVPDAAEKLNIAGFNKSFGRKQEEAIKDFEECIKKYPDFEWPYSNLASIYIQQGKSELAVPLLRKALEINPMYSNAIAHMADAQISLGNREAAHSYLQQAILNDPDDWHLKLQDFALRCSL